jgi:hypothetical protein
MSRSSLLLFVAAFVMLGCAEGRMSCRVGADCASGVCMSDGTCAAGHDAGPVDAPLTHADGGETDAAEDDTGIDTDGGERLCSPDHDGVVTRAEVPLRAGLRANFRIAENATVSTMGTTSGGARTWDYSGAYSGDRDELVELLEPAGWWAADFPTATHAARVSASSDNLGVFQITDDALLLLGVVSPEAGLTQTRLVYDPPVTVLAFPIAEGNTFTTTSSVTGQAVGVLAAYTEEYTSIVDASGTLVTPFGETAALRVRTEMTRTSGFATLTSQRQFTFVAECFGIAAVLVSNAFETNVEFTTASEIRRLSP